MFIELVELLRCIRTHAESWLVASIDDLRGRSIHRGKLGCPVCSAEYPIVEGTADFSGATVSPHLAKKIADPDEVALRAGAFLGLAESAGTVILGGAWAAGAETLAESTGSRVFAANSLAKGDRGTTGHILIANAFPFSAGSCAGVALDGAFDQRAIDGAVRVIRPGGRIIAPSSLRRPDGISLIAEDAEWWVGGKPPEVTTLRRGNR